MACYGAGSASAAISLPNGTVDINGNSTLDCCYCAGGTTPPPGELPILTCTDPAACNYNQVGTCIFPGRCDRVIRIVASMSVFYEQNPNSPNYGAYLGTCGDYTVSATCGPGLVCAEFLGITDAYGGQDYTRPGEFRNHYYRIPGDSAPVTFTVNYFNTNSDTCRKIICGPTVADICEARNNPICGAAACDNASPIPGPVPSDNPNCPGGHAGVIQDLGGGIIETVGFYGYSDINNTCYEEYLVPLVATVSPFPEKTCECPSLVP
jgi:hypothetical protein